MLQFYKQANFGYLDSKSDFKDGIISIYEQMILSKKPNDIVWSKDLDEDEKKVLQDLREERRKTKRCDYAFTPWEFSQAVLGSNTPIPKDPYYFEAIQKVAKKCLNQVNINNTDCTNAQAQAIIAIDQSNLPNKKEFYDFVLTIPSPDAQKFISIINCAHEMSDYIYVKTLKEGGISEKSEKIYKHTPLYMGSIIQSTYEFLQEKNSSDELKSQFVKKIQDAENEFRKEALSIHRGLINKIFFIISSKIAQICIFRDKWISDSERCGSLDFNQRLI